jgi:hypothetical protein
MKMKGTRQSEEQIIAILKQAGGGVSDGGFVRQHGTASKPYSLEGEVGRYRSLHA